MSRNAVLSTLALLLAALVLLGDATNVRSRRSEHEQHVLAGTVQQDRIEAEQLQKARECTPAQFPYHQMAVHGGNFMDAVAKYSEAIHESGADKRIHILNWAKHHDFGYNEAVKSNGYALAPLFDRKGDLAQSIQQSTDMATAFRNKAQNPFYDANGAAAHADLKAVAKPGKKFNSEELNPMLAEDFGQLHEAYSALLYLGTPTKTVTAAGPAGEDVAGMAIIAGTLSGANFGAATLGRIKTLHAAVKLLSQKDGSKYSGEPGAAYKNLFDKMENVVNGIIKLDTKIDGLTIEEWFNGGFVGDFLYTLEYKDGSICKQANCFAEFYAYGGVAQASKGMVGGGLDKTATAQESWNAFWGGQPRFVGIMEGMLKGKPGVHDDDSDKTKRTQAMTNIQGCKANSIFSTCPAFTHECTFAAGGFWQKKK